MMLGPRSSVYLFSFDPKINFVHTAWKKKQFKKIKFSWFEIENRMTNKKNPWVKHVKAVAKAKKITFSKALKVASPSYWKEVAKTTKKKK